LRRVFFLIFFPTILLGLKKVNKIGRTVPSFRPALEHEIESWKDFKRALRPEEKSIFDKLMNFARIHADAGSLSARPLLSEILFISFAIEQEKRIAMLERKVAQLEEKPEGKKNR
jgi:hypothetical protein